MRLRGLATLAFALVLFALPLAAQSDSSSMKPKAQPGMIRGAGNRSGAGEIHLVGQRMGAQQVHFTDAFKVEPSATLHAMLGLSMSVTGAADLGAIASAGDQLIPVPKTVDAGAYALLLIYDTKTRAVVASAILPNARGQAYAEKGDTSMPQHY